MLQIFKLKPKDVLMKTRCTTSSLKLEDKYFIIKEPPTSRNAQIITISKNKNDNKSEALF